MDIGLRVLLGILLLRTFPHKFLFEHLLLSLLASRSGISGLRGDSVFNILRNCQIIFQNGVHHFTFSSAMWEGSSFSTEHLLLFFNTLLAAVRGMWDLSSSTRDQACDPCVGNAEF